MNEHCQEFCNQCRHYKVVECLVCIVITTDNREQYTAIVLHLVEDEPQGADEDLNEEHDGPIGF